jgi:hypothetical protein
VEGQARTTHFHNSINDTNEYSSNIDDTNEYSSDIDDTNEFDNDIDDNIDSTRQEKWVENFDSSALAPTRDYPRILSADIPNIRIVRIFSRIRISRIVSGYRYPW